MTRAQRILDEVRRLPTEERMDVLQGVVDFMAPALSPEQEKGLADAIDEADKGDLVDGPTVRSRSAPRKHFGIFSVAVEKSVWGTIGSSTPAGTGR